MFSVLFRFETIFLLLTPKTNPREAPTLRADSEQPKRGGPESARAKLGGLKGLTTTLSPGKEVAPRIYFERLLLLQGTAFKP